MLLRGANWDFARAQIALTQLKAVIVNGAVSSDPPPQPWQVQYAYPSDGLKIRFLQPTLATQSGVDANGVPLTTAPNVGLPVADAPTAIPFVPATAFDSGGNPIKIVLTNLYQAQAIYTRDLSAVPDLWDSLFLAAATATLAAYFINALARNRAQMDEQVTIAKGAIETARAANGNESISSVDHVPDWMQARRTSAVPWGWNTTGPSGVYSGGWDTCAFPNGQFF